MRPLFGPRTVVEAAFLVAVPVIALEAGVSWYAIVAAGAVAYILVLGIETVLWRQARRALPPPPPEPLAEEVVALPSVRVTRPEPEAEPVPAPVPVPEPELPSARTVAPIDISPVPRQWNVWDLEQLAREHGGSDPIADEERTFLLLYLRDFAGPDGLLPVDFDELVRQTFGGLVAR